MAIFEDEEEDEEEEEEALFDCYAHHFNAPLLRAVSFVTPPRFERRRLFCRHRRRFFRRAARVYHTVSSDEKAETMTTTGRKRKRSGGETPTLTTDLDELKKHHAFLRDDDRENDDEEEEEKKKKNAREGERMAIKYEEKLFKEYAIPDLSRCDEGVGLRWRTKQEVARGKGVDVCGEKRCSERRNLGTFELNFRYKERGEVKNALVKVVVCPTCEEKLHRSRRKKKK